MKSLIALHWIGLFYPISVLSEISKKSLKSNVLPVLLGGTKLCGQNGFFNQLCTTIQVCTPETNSCQEITDILVDTGSVGIRIFSQALKIPLPNILEADQQVAECATFGIGSDWGPLVRASIVLGGEDPITLAIQKIDSSFPHAPKNCHNSDLNPEAVGFNGILGVGLFEEDCGIGCAFDPNSQVYFLCTDKGCGSTIRTLENQLRHPVTLLPHNNNGLILELMPLRLEKGSQQVSGQIILGIDTQLNNQAGDVEPLFTDSRGQFLTQFEGQTYSFSLFDTGANALYFPLPEGLKKCSSLGIANSFYCPAQTVRYDATVISPVNHFRKKIFFRVSNAELLFRQPSSIFQTVAGAYPNGFDWGIPFFIGRKIFLGIASRTSTLGTGPYWAF